jgi:pyridoxal phosphate enzyme (YggS family)
VDSLRLAQEIDRRCQDISKVMPVLVQVNVAGEETKFGIRTDEVAGLVRQIRKLENLRLDGLMTIPPFFSDPEDSRPYFRRLAECRNELESQGLGPLPELSMGMSGDYEVAIEEGATYVRVGSALFGERF